jgi:hypothetical protein
MNDNNTNPEESSEANKKMYAEKTYIHNPIKMGKK